MRIRLFFECIRLINAWRTALDQTDTTMELLFAVIASYGWFADDGHEL